MKVAQEVLGHKDVSTTLDIYTDVTKELAKREFDNLEEKLSENFDIMNQMGKKTLESEDQDDT